MLNASQIFLVEAAIPSGPGFCGRTGRISPMECSVVMPYIQALAQNCMQLCALAPVISRE